MSTETKHTYRATLPDGTEITRTTTHDYSHAVIAHDDRGWGVFRWTSRLDLAEQAQRQYRQWPMVDDVRIIPVSNPR